MKISMAAAEEPVRRRKCNHLSHIFTRWMLFEALPLMLKRTDAYQ